MFIFDRKTIDSEIFLLIISYCWFANYAIKNMIMQIMINVLNDFYDDTKCLCTKFEVIWTNETELWAKKFWDFENGLVCIFCPPTWLLHYKCMEIS